MIQFTIITCGHAPNVTIIFTDERATVPFNSSDMRSAIFEAAPATHL